MRRTIYYDFTKCDLEVLEGFYYSIKENERKKFLGDAICNFLLWAHELGKFSDKEFYEVMSAFFPQPESIEYEVKIPVIKKKLRKSEDNNSLKKLWGISQ